MTMRGYLITLEGIDGTGKSTVAAMLARMLEREDSPIKREFVFTAEPTESEVGRLLKKRLQTGETSGLKHLEDLFLFMADHADHLAEEVIPALDRGAVVISDRYSDSRVAYQGATLRGIVPDPMTWVRELHEPWSMVPDLTILFALDPSTAVERCKSRSCNAEPERFEQEALLRKVAENFHSLAELEPDRFVLIDAGRGPEDVFEQVLAAITGILGV